MACLLPSEFIAFEFLPAQFAADRTTMGKIVQDSMYCHPRLVRRDLQYSNPVQSTTTGRGYACCLQKEPTTCTHGGDSPLADRSTKLCHLSLWCNSDETESTKLYRAHMHAHLAVGQSAPSCIMHTCMSSNSQDTTGRHCLH